MWAPGKSFCAVWTAPLSCFRVVVCSFLFPAGETEEENDEFYLDVWFCLYEDLLDVFIVGIWEAVDLEILDMVYWNVTNIGIAQENPFFGWFEVASP